MMKFKYVVKNTVWEQGKTATFMPKPIFGDNGSGMHTHQSLWKNGEPLFYDERGYGGLSDLARWYIGGLLKHAPALLAFTNPTVNSYHRLVPGYEAPVNLVYSARNRSACVRIPIAGDSPKAKRIEFRIPDPSSNPYLCFAAQLMAGLDGIKNRIEPPEPVDKDLYELPPEEHEAIAQVPGSLPEVLLALEADHEFLLEGDVFTDGPHRDLDRVEAQERGRPDPLPPAPARVRDVLRHLIVGCRPPCAVVGSPAARSADSPQPRRRHRVRPCCQHGRTRLCERRSLMVLSGKGTEIRSARTLLWGAPSEGHCTAESAPRVSADGQGLTPAQRTVTGLYPCLQRISPCEGTSGRTSTARPRDRRRIVPCRLVRLGRLGIPDGFGRTCRRSRMARSPELVGRHTAAVAKTGTGARGPRILGV